MIRNLAVAMLVVAATAGCAPRATRNGATTLRIYLARHGQTDWNAVRRLQGQTDTQLDATGREQAAMLAEVLKDVPLDRVYSSTLQRSRTTAETVRGAAPLEALDGLREQALGRFEGQRMDGSDSTGAAEFTRRRKNPDDALDGGESENQFFARVQGTIDRIVAAHPAGTILVVGHGGTNAMILRALLGLSAEQAAGIRQANDELYAIDLAPPAVPRLWKRIGQGNLGDL